MVDLVLLFGKILLLILLYMFLLAAVRTGIGAVVGATPKQKRQREWVLAVTRGPAELRGVHLPVVGPLLIGRSDEADLVIANDFVSSQHARVTPGVSGPVIEDLGSTNGTVVNGQAVDGQVPLKTGDTIELGPVSLRVERS